MLLLYREEVVQYLHCCFLKYVNMVLNVRRNTRLIRDGENGVGVGWGEGYGPVGEEGGYVPIATLSPPD